MRDNPITQPPASFCSCWQVKKKNNGGIMYKCQIRLQIIREKEKLEELRLFKLFDDVTRKQQKRHIRIIKEKIKILEEELKKKDE